MIKTQKLTGLLLSLLFSACAFGPFTTHETARTLGKGNHEFAGGYGQTSYVLKWNTGITDRIDFGVHWEALSIGIRGKFGIIQGGQDQFSLAAALGVGSSIGGSHQYADLLASYLKNKWEPYGVFRYVKIKVDPVDILDKETGKTIFTLEDVNLDHYDYGLATLGVKYLINDNWSFSAEATKIIPVSSSFKVESAIFAGAAFTYRL